MTSLIFYDFEVFKHDWLVVLTMPIEKQEKVIINSREEFIEFYGAHKDHIWIGYNSREYDQYIAKAIICGFDPYAVNEYIIVKRRRGWQFSRLFNQIPLNNFDMMPNPPIGLKTLEAFMGHNIKETSVPFNIDRKLTADELAMTIKYCQHDVHELIEVFIARKEEFDASMFLIKNFELPLSDISKTKAQLVATIVGGNGKGKQFTDEYDYQILDCINIQRYTRVLDFFKNAKRDAKTEMEAEQIEVFNQLNEAKAAFKPSQTKINRLQDRFDELDSKNPDLFKKYFYSRSLTIDVGGVPHIFAWGGIHGASDQPYYGEGIYMMADVEAYYPSMAIVNEFGKRVCNNWENFVLIHSENLRLKHIDKKKRKPFKIADNGFTGQLKDAASKLYDPMANNCICVNGQLMLLDLIERLEEASVNVKLIQSNTDGILLKMESMDDYETIDDVVYEWEKRTGMHMEFDLYKKVYQKDVNNYCIVGMDGKTKTKGAYVKQLSDLDNDLPIINKAMVDYMINGTPVEKTINECNELKMFQKVVKVSSLYLYAMHNGHTLTDKTFRVFASNDPNDTTIYKVKNSEKNPEKFANAPQNCFIENDDINSSNVIKKLDKKWYIELAQERLRQFGVL